MGRQEEHLMGVWAPSWCQRPWHLQLLAASILSSFFLLTHAQGGVSLEKLVKAEPSRPLEGQNITLIPEKPLAGLLNCLWYRGFTTDTEDLIVGNQVSHERQNNGSAYTGREMAGPGCALHIRNLTFKDSGTYTVTMGTLSAVETRHVRIEVSDPSLFRTGAIDGITIGAIVLLASAGILLYCFFRICAQDEKNSSQAISTCVYENMPFSPKKSWVETQSCFLSTYQTLSHGDEAEYDYLQW